MNRLHSFIGVSDVVRSAIQDAHAQLDKHFDALGRRPLLEHVTLQVIPEIGRYNAVLTIGYKHTGAL